MGSAGGLGGRYASDGGGAEMIFFAGMVLGMTGGVIVTVGTIAFMMGATK
ncbi:hypothetical protein ZBT109_2617 [Zymobacter palmae]|uniref:Uncharacterized protein n=1 Tax=Zymobacter palmae TaxID=33074 RepID=A0A348HI95_9GAMM|nr:hypothetical protein ZBT109_2617 [Zymobacter palmae]